MGESWLVYCKTWVNYNIHTKQMAYGNIYYAGWHSSSKKGYLYIDKRDYVGSASALILKRDGFTISTNWQKPLLGMTAEFSIMNLKENFFELLPLLSGKETEYRVRIETTNPTAVSLFEGFLNCDTITEKYLYRQSINFVASSYLAKLEDIHPVSVDTLQNITLLKVINEILRSTGCDFPIRINSILRAQGDTLTTGHTLFDKNGFFTELYWEDNIERVTSLEILKSILITFNCYLYWHDKYWYIERYEEIWNTSVNYVEYSDAQSAAGVGTVVVIANTISKVHDLVFTSQSQTLAVNPGLKTIKINLKDQRFANLVNSDLTNIITKPSGSEFLGNWIEPYVYPALRTWEVYGSRWDKAGEPFSILSNSIQRKPGASWVALRLEEGLATSFRVTILNEQTSLEIKFGYIVEDTFPEDTLKLKDYTFRFYYYLKSVTTGAFVVSSGEEGDKVFRMQEAFNALTYLQHIDIDGSAFDINNKSVTVEISIPLGLVDMYALGLFSGKLIGDQSFVLCIGAATMIHYSEDDPPIPTETQIQWGRFGDINVTETGEIHPNVIEGTYELNYLNKEEVDLDLYDTESYSYKNAILRSADLSTRTEKWGMLAGVSVINARGVCYSNTNAIPNLSNPHTVNGSGFGVFQSYIHGLAVNTLYYVRAYATDGDGVTTYGSVITFTTLNIVVGSTYQGGIVAYIFQFGETGYVIGETHGLIISIGNLSDSSQLARITGGGPYTADTARTALGGGFANTTGMLANLAHTSYSLFAVNLIKAYNDMLAGDFGDWFLPCWFELTAVWKNREILKMSKLKYWSSSEPEDGDLGIGASEWKYGYAIDFGINSTSAHYPYHYTESIGYWKKTHGFAVRAVRQF